MRPPERVSPPFRSTLCKSEAGRGYKRREEVITEEIMIVIAPGDNRRHVGRCTRGEKMLQVKR